MSIRADFSGSTGANSIHRTPLDPIQSQSRVPGHLLTNSEIRDNPTTGTSSQQHIPRGIQRGVVRTTVGKPIS